MMPEQTSVTLALGSNLGDRYANLNQALAELGSHISIEKTSSVYQTPPWGYLEQPEFFNQVIIGSTALDANETLNFVKNIEQKMGRVSNFQNGPRLIDIDILLFGSQIINTDKLVIPHQNMLKRGFVLMPLAEIEPELIIPGTQKSVTYFLQKADQTGIKKISCERDSP